MNKMSHRYRFVQLDVFTKTLHHRQPARHFLRTRARNDQPSQRLRLGKRCEFSVCLFQLVVGQAHRAQECVPARVTVEIG